MRNIPEGSIKIWKGGYVVNYSRNLRGIREYTQGKGLTCIASVQVRDSRACGPALDVQWSDGATATASFADFTVLCGFVHNWRNARGCTLEHNGTRITIDDLAKMAA